MKVESIKLSNIDSFENHPYKVENDVNLKELANSIKNNGLLNPILVRPKSNGRYEIISGHRRLEACKINKEKEISCIIKDLSKDEAIIDMVDSNIQRENILPSEKAFAYKMKLEAMKHQGKRVTTLAPMDPKSSTELIGLEFGESSATVKRFVRLTYLIPELLKYVDNSYKKESEDLTMGLRPAVELSYLSTTNQKLVVNEIEYNQSTPSHAQTIKIRALAEKNKLNDEVLDNIFEEEKGNQHDQISFNKKNIESVLPEELLKRDKRYVEQFIVSAIKNYSKQLALERGDNDDLVL
jgi:ParB family transcriptional regulator, chromosome partitioning protein